MTLDVLPSSDIAGEIGTPKIPGSCTRCRSQKVRCSREKPKCHTCQQAKHPVECIYSIRDRKISVSESFLKELQEENKTLKRKRPETTATIPAATKCLDRRVPIESSSMGAEIVSNAPDGRADNGLDLVPDETSIQPQYIGEAACTTFVRRLKQHINGYQRPPSPSPSRYYKHSHSFRISPIECQLPDRIAAQLLIRTVLRFIGPDYHLILRKSLPEKLVASYQMTVYDDPIWMCRLFILFALGELYAQRTPIGKKGKTVPGTAFFLKAMALLQEIDEEPTISYIETLLLISYYSLALNRKNTAYAYSGSALRLSLTLGLHRNIPEGRTTSPRDREHRIRVFWTVYVMDREGASQCGLPITLQDRDIDVPLPSNDGLSDSDKEDFHNPTHLIALTKLARITGDIINDIYCIPQPNQVNIFVLSVQRILANLRSWNETLPPVLQFNRHTTPMYSSRSTASLHLNFSQCVILTTRPIFLHLFRSRMNLTSNNGSNTGRPLSQMTEALAEACVQAARTLSAILAQLWVDGSLAIFGYFDSHALFSSIMILMMATTLKSNITDDDAVKTSLSLLRSMRDDGNLSASDHYDLLRSLKIDLEEARKQAINNANGTVQPILNNSGLQTFTPTFNSIVEEGEQAGEAVVDTDLSNANETVIAEAMTFGVFENLDSAAVLDDPFLQSFLAQQQPRPGSWQTEAVGLFPAGIVNADWNLDWENATAFNVQ